VNDVVSTGEVTGSETPGINPAWNDALSSVPEQFHSILTPHFQKWDQAANSRIEEVNSKLKSFEDYNPLIEHGISMGDVQQALLLAQEINTNPRSVFDALNQAYNFSAVVEAATEGATQPGETPAAQDDPRFSQLEQQLGLVSQILLQENEAKEAAKQDAWLENAIGSALMKFPDLALNKQEENFVLAQMWQNGMDADAAVQAFVDFKNSLAPQPFAPKILGGVGGTPSQAIDPTKLSGKDTRNLVAQMLAAAQAQNQ